MSAHRPLLAARGVLCWAALAVGLCCCGVARADGPELPPGAHKALYQAQQAAGAGQDAHALEILDAYIKAAPASGEQVPALVFLVQGAARYRLGRMDAAAKSFAESVRLAPRDPDARLNLGMALLGAAKPGPAAEAVEAAFGLYRERGDVRPELLYRAAVCHYQAGATAGARRTLEALWALNPPDAPDEWHRLWIQVLCDGKEWQAAERAVTGRLEARRGDRKLWELLAQVRANDGRYADAASALEVADALAPLGRAELLFLADMHAVSGAPLRAAGLLERLAAKEPSAELHDRLAQLLEQGLRLPEAVAHARKALALRPAPARLRNLARLLLAAGEHKALAALCREQVRNDAQGGEVLLLAAISAIQTQAWDDARALLLRAAKDPATRPGAAAWRAVLDDLDNTRREAQAASLDPAS
ncbi:hypothetical protein [Desulfocurvus sp.]|uniref:tetratricopeptide repeat protein n=1 Tax=Desulfocurvus sp. TaxID=2871698 RepID=UPI0025BE8F43|nr:hypothetical protein [Desulfocurvus sp.]MCK9241181.1 hypothetical protein [Desulfocurvus sp.]